MKTLKEIEKDLAYNKAKNAIEFCCWPRRGGWFDTGDSMAAYLTDEIFYLQSIGALQVHPKNPAFIKVRGLTNHGYQKSKTTYRGFFEKSTR